MIIMYIYYIYNYIDISAYHCFQVSSIWSISWAYVYIVFMQIIIYI